MISADRITLARQATDLGNAVAGTVVGEEFVGAVVTLYLDVGNGIELRVQTQQHTLDDLDLTRGTRLVANWRPEHTFTLPQTDTPAGTPKEP